MALATGQITIIDLNDAVTLQGYLNGSQANGQSVNLAGTVFTPSWFTTDLVITATLSKMGSGVNIIGDSEVGSIVWTYILGNGAETPIASLGSAVATGTKGQVLTISDNKMTLTYPSIKFIATFVYTHATLGALTYKMDISYTLQKQGDAGLDSYTVIMGNESQSFSASEAGAISPAQIVTSTVTAYKGATQVSATIGTITNPSGMTLVVSNNSTTAPLITITATASSSLAANGTVSVPITVDGKVFTKLFSYSKVLGGTSATTYKITPSVAVIVKTKAGAFMPLTVTFSALTQFGSAAATAYTVGRYKIYESTDGVTFGAALYTSSANEATKVYTPTATAKAVKGELYLTNGVTTLLDYQGVTVVTDGVDTITSVGSTPDGNVFYNTIGTNPILKANIDVYNGNTLVTPAWLWFYQDPTVTTTGSAGYNAKGGLGWHLIANAAGLYANATTREISIYANAVAGYEVLKCVATYSSVDYPQFYVITDQTDPYQVVIDSTGGDKFKNAVGTSVLTAKVMQAGLPLDETGATGAAVPIFTSYTWSKYDQDGVLAAFTPVGAEVGKTSGVSTTTAVLCDAAAYAGFGIGSKILVGAETVRTVTAKAGTTLTVGVALSGIPASGTSIKDGSLKRIYVTDADVEVKATFYCDVN